MNRKTRVLVVEDSEIDQEMIRRIILRANADARITFVQSLEDATSELANSYFPILILDNNLPDGLGVDMLLASDSLLKTTAVVMVSDWPSPFIFAKARQKGVHVIPKEKFSTDLMKTLFYDMSLQARARKVAP